MRPEGPAESASVKVTEGGADVDKLTAFSRAVAKREQDLDTVLA
jgi:hypothetical protein